MKERERILDLVKQGIISTEEALTLLENIAKKEGKEAVKKDQSNVQKPIPPKEPVIEPEAPEAEEDFQAGEEQYEAEQEKDRIRLEAILEELANEASRYSAQLDVKNAEITDLDLQLKRAEEKLMVLETMEDLDELDSEKEPELKKLSQEIEELEAQLNDLKEDKAALNEKLRTVRQKQWGTQKKQITDKFEIPDDWKDAANETLNQVGGKMSEVGNQFGKLMKNTFSTVMDNMDWKDVNIRVPGLAATKLTHEFNYPASTATILDVKVANGDVLFKNWDSEDIKIETDIKIYGKIDSDSPFEAFLKRSTVEVSEEKVLFHVPNKRIRCDVVFYLPERMYDHSAIKLLNGNVKFEAFEGKDIYVKCTNGNMFFEKVTATMLETEGVNGTVTVIDSKIRDLVVNSINGGIVTRGDIQGANLSTVNGTVKVTISGEELKRLEATSVNGTVKVSLPKELSVEGNAKSNLGTIQNRMENIEIVKEKKDRTNQLSEFRRYLESAPVTLIVSTTTGNILLKDTE
ncbi:MAG: daptomycin-sensing surface protein LiaX [Carnobacterium sp.]|uniref:Daptomycin-sensing surface protein LiaX n=1 Tax=Carnobacterium antarcticum TaxID=2126436 RepID=A0ABW4NNB9_9LACT|nr:MULTISPECIES: daptomycin-sensing surface protein LiaX [unclassified Carnobacterium]ALV22734.1 hypothetical protein NY10_2147 [Carnobacterium sp. CP1]QQP70630.1 daptomycin-sensing surface protein LiaX [Carnobacterium sp. CS13]